MLAGALALICAVAAAGTPKLKVALTFDDLPLNGTLPLGAMESDFARDTIKVLKKHRIPPSYGFINANKLERNPDGAKALQIWVKGGHPLANHTYTHLDFTKNSVEDFQREILRNEPALELLMPEDGKQGRWSWFRYPYLHEGDTLEKRRAVRAFLASSGYRIAQTTLDFEDYLWNSAHARCSNTRDEASIQWLRESYRTAARDFTRFQIQNSRAIFVVSAGSVPSVAQNAVQRQNAVPRTGAGPIRLFRRRLFQAAIVQSVKTKLKSPVWW